ncbi:MAG: alkaline phosphatase family protein [Huintestinicola sp.]
MLVYPNYSRSVVNVIASIKKYYRIPPHGDALPPLPSLDSELTKIYKNVVLLIVSGVSENMLKSSLKPGSILLREMKDTVTSVCPSSSASSRVSCLTGTPPCEHGRLGRTMFFKEFCRTVELDSNLDPYSGQNVSAANAADFVLPYSNFFGEIADSIIGNVQPFSIAMPGVKISENKSFHKTADTPLRLFELMIKIAATDQNTFTYAEWGAVRAAAEKYGCESAEVKQMLCDINDTIEGMSKRMTDTIFIITSDHGMTDISEEILLNLSYDLCDCLIMPPTFGKRAVNFFVKSDRRTDFERIFAERFSADFMLMSRSEILRKELFGTGRCIGKIYDFLGDYVAFGISDKAMKFRTLTEKHRAPDKAMCGGITSDEMILPLSVVKTKLTPKWRRPFTENITPDFSGQSEEEGGSTFEKTV